MPRKKIVFIIVEGPSDETALGVPLSRYFTGSSVYVDIIHGDMTTKYGINPLNIRKHLMKKVKSYADRNHYKRDDFLRVIQIIDTDGAYIPDANIVCDESADRPVYTDTSIMTAKYEQMIDRNVTVLFVSHSLKEVVDTCNKAMILDHGVMTAFGSTEEVAPIYEAMTEK